MAKLLTPIQPLLLFQSGAIPELPNPLTLMPGDAGFDISINMMVGQQAYNIVDNKWFFRTPAGIEELLIKDSYSDYIKYTPSKTVREALDELLQKDGGELLIEVYDASIAKDAIITIYDTSDSSQVFQGTTTAGVLTQTLPYGKYDVELNIQGYDLVEATTTIDDNDLIDNLVAGTTCYNVDVGNFVTTIVCNIAPSILPVIDSFEINDGAATSSNENLRLNLNTSGIVDQIMISQDVSFTGAIWQDCPDPSDHPFTFNYVDEITVTLHVKVKNSQGESAVASDSIQMLNGIIRSDIATTYNSLDSVLEEVIADYPGGLTEDITIEVISEVLNTTTSIFLTKFENFNEGTDYTLTIKGNNLITIDCGTTGGFRLDDSNNVIFSGINLINVGNLKERSTPDQVPGFFINNCTNIIIDNCNLNGQYTDDGSSGWYAIIVKDNNNFTLSNTTLEWFGATGITISDTVAVTLKKVTMRNCYINRSVVSQPALVELSYIESLSVQDCDIDGTGMDTCFSGNNIIRADFDRTKMYNCPGEIIAFRQSEFCQRFTMRNCLVYNNLTSPYYYWTKQQIALGAYETIEFINNTIELTPISGTNLYATFVKSSHTFDYVTIYNNIFDFNMTGFVNNDADGRLFEFGKVGSLDSNYNLYRDFSSDGDSIANMMILITDDTSPVYINRINSLSELQSLGSDLNSTIINPSDDLFVGGDRTVLDSAILSLLVDTSKLPQYDIDKYVPLSGNLGCKYDGAVPGIDTNLDFSGFDTVTNLSFDSDDIEFIVNSNSLLVLKLNTYNDNDIYKWIFTNDALESFTLYGNNLGVQLQSQVDGNNLYVDDSVYSIEIINIQL